MIFPFIGRGHEQEEGQGGKRWGWGRGEREYESEAESALSVEPDVGLDVTMQDHDIRRNQESDAQLNEPLRRPSR